MSVTKIEYIGSQQQIHMRPGTTWYVADLPGHNGLVKATTGASDWGWTDDPAKAIQMSVYWVRRFIAYCRRDSKRPFKISVRGVREVAE